MRLKSAPGIAALCEQPQNIIFCQQDPVGKVAKKSQVSTVYRIYWALDCSQWVAKCRLSWVGRHSTISPVACPRPRPPRIVVRRLATLRLCASPPPPKSPNSNWIIDPSIVPAPEVVCVAVSAVPSHIASPPLVSVPHWTATLMCVGRGHLGSRLPCELFILSFLLLTVSFRLPFTSPPSPAHVEID